MKKMNEYPTIRILMVMKWVLLLFLVLGVLAKLSSPMTDQRLFVLRLTQAIGAFIVANVLLKIRFPYIDLSRFFEEGNAGKIIGGSIIVGGIIIAFIVATLLGV